MTDRLEKLERQQQELNARIKAEKAKLAKQQRKDDTRRKIITGAVIREHMDRFPNDDASRKIAALLDSHVSKSGDRELLGLTPRKDATTETEDTPTAVSDTSSAALPSKPPPLAKAATPPSEADKPKPGLGSFFGGSKN